MEELLSFEQAAAEKRPEFLEKLSEAQTFDDIRDAIEWFAVEGAEDVPVVVNFMEGAYKDDNITDGAFDLDVILAGLAELEEGGAVSVEEVQAKMPIFAVEEAAARLLGLAGDRDGDGDDEPVDSTI